MAFFKYRDQLKGLNVVGEPLIHVGPRQIPIMMLRKQGPGRRPKRDEPFHSSFVARHCPPARALINRVRDENETEMYRWFRLFDDVRAVL